MAEEKSEDWHDETIYFLMTDRFMNGDRTNDKQVNNEDPAAYQGGDFKGVEDQLNFLEEMGITSIVLSPVFENEKGAYHGYKVTDYNKMNKQFGTKAELKRLVQKAHDLNIRVLVDFPATRMSIENAWAKDPAKADWFTSLSSTQQPEWLGNMAEVNTSSENVQKALIDSAVTLAEDTDIDGYFFSNASEVQPAFWTAFADKLSDLHLIGEMNDVTPEEAAAYEEAGLDSITSSWMQQPLREQFATVDRSSEEVKELLLNEQKKLKDPLAAIHVMDSAFTDRFTLDMANENMFPGTRWKLALTYLYTTPGTPAFFYGSEIAQNGESGVEAHGLMNFRTDKELVDYIKDIAEQRANLPALRRGSYESIYEKDGMSVFKRTYKDETLIVAINNTSETQRVTIPSDKLDSEKELRGLLSGDTVRPNGETFTVIVNREESEIYALAERTGINYAYIGAVIMVNVIFIFFLYFAWKRGKRSKKQK